MLQERLACWALACVVWHEGLAATAAGLGAYGALTSPVTAACRGFGARAPAPVAAAAGVVTKATFAAIAIAIAARTAAKATTVVAAFVAPSGRTVATKAGALAGAGVKAWVRTLVVAVFRMARFMAAFMAAVWVAVAAFATTGRAIATRTTTALKATLWAAALGEVLGGFQARNHVGLERLAAVAFDVENLAAVAEFGKGHGQAIAPGTARAANAVGVVLGLHRQAEVEDVGDGGHINATCRHIGGHQNLHLTIAQRHQAAVAQALAECAVQCDSGKAFLLQVLGQAIVFASTQVECDGLANDLQQEGFSAVALHGALSQGLRNRRLMALRSGQVQILVATDVAARGIDVPTITHVFNFGLPMKAEDYTYRIGRTGRAGRDGLAVTFAEFRDRRKIFDIEGYSRQQFKADVVEGLEPAQRFPQGSRPDFGGRGGREGGRGREQRFGGAGRGHGDRGGFGDRAGFGDRGPRAGFGADRGAERGAERGGFGGRRDGDGYGRKGGFGETPRFNEAPRFNDAPRFGDAPRHGHGNGRSDGGAPRGDFARKGDFAKPGFGKGGFAKPHGGTGKSFTPHEARKRPARNDR